MRSEIATALLAFVFLNGFSCSSGTRYTIQTNFGKNCNDACESLNLTCNFTDLNQMNKAEKMETLRKAVKDCADQIFKYSVKDHADHTKIVVSIIKIGNWKQEYYHLPLIIHQQDTIHTCVTTPPTDDIYNLCQCQVSAKDPGQTKCSWKDAVFTFARKKYGLNSKCSDACFKHHTKNLTCVDNCGTISGAKHLALLRKMIMEGITRVVIGFNAESASAKWDDNPLLVLPEVKIRGYDAPDYTCHHNSWVHGTNGKYRICECHGADEPIDANTHTPESVANSSGEVMNTTNAKETSVSEIGREETTTKGSQGWRHGQLLFLSIQLFILYYMT